MGIINRLLQIQECQSVHGEHVDWFLELVHWFMLLLFIGWSIFLTVVLIRYHHSRQRRAVYSGVTSHATSHIEVGVIIVEVVLLLGFAFPLWGQRVDAIPPDPDVNVQAVGQQFAWNFQYAGADKVFGQRKSKFISSGNPVGIDPNDPNGKDDFVSAELVLPVDKKIVIGVTSKDVIHNLALKGVRQATDAVPNQINRVWFIPNKAGTSEIICGQLCGGGHAGMVAKMVIVDDKKYAEWLSERELFGNSAAAAPAGQAPAPAAEAEKHAPAPGATQPEPKKEEEHK